MKEEFCSKDTEQTEAGRKGGEEVRGGEMKSTKRGGADRSIKEETRRNNAGVKEKKKRRL